MSINTTYQKIEKDGSDLENNHIYYLIKIFDAENNPVKKAPLNIMLT